MVLFGEPARKDGGKARRARERMAGRGLVGVRGMGEVWQGMACTTAANGVGAGRGGLQFAREKSLQVCRLSAW